MNVAIRAGLVAAALAGAIIFVASEGAIENAARGDGLVYQYVAMNLTIDPSDVHEEVVARGTSLRYGRIGLPVVTWLFAAGNATAIPYAQVAAIVIAAAGVGAMVGYLFHRSETGLMGGLAFISVGFSVSIFGGFAEPVAVALGLGAVLAALSGRWWLTALLLAAATLTRENAAFIGLGLAVYTLSRGEVRATLKMCSAVVPVVAWWLVVRARFGHLPPLDPYLREDTSTIGLPGVAIAQSILAPMTTPAFWVALGHVVVAVIVVVFARRGILGAVAVGTAVQVLIAGPFIWHHIGDAFRTQTFLQVFAVLALLSVIRPGWVHEEVRESERRAAAPG